MGAVVTANTTVTYDDIPAQYHGTRVQPPDWNCGDASVIFCALFYSTVSRTRASAVRPRDPNDPFDRRGIEAMRRDHAMMAASQTFLNKTFEHRYYRNFTWLGRPIIQYPQDIVALQELIWDYRPTLVIETGVAHGGSLVLYASIFELVGGTWRSARRRSGVSTA